MCEYSLAYFPNRLAAKGEHLLVYRFPCGTIGLAPARRSLLHWLFPSGIPAVCIPPGARLRLQDIALSLQRRLKIAPVEEVTFTQQSAAAFTFRDAVRFSNGRSILLQGLEHGQRVQVLSLENAEEDESQAASTARNNHSARERSPWAHSI